MAGEFDPYHKWLGIPPTDRPPTHYQLLGISPDEHDLDVIGAAADKQCSFVRNFQSGKYTADAARLLSEIAAAKSCLLNPKLRQAYDRQIGISSSPTGGSAISGSAIRGNASPSKAVRSPSPTAAGGASPFDDDLFGPAGRMPSQGALSTSHRSRPMRRLPTASRNNPNSAYIWQIPLTVAVALVLMFLAVQLSQRGAENAANPAATEAAAGNNP